MCDGCSLAGDTRPVAPRHSEARRHELSVASWFASGCRSRATSCGELTNEPVPNHMKRWWFCLGGTPAYLFVVQIVTGILLATLLPAVVADRASSRCATSPTTSPYGWYFRSLHKWAATLMIAAVILHQMRVYFTGAYRRPREINWMIGMCLLLCDARSRLHRLQSRVRATELLGRDRRRQHSRTPFLGSAGRSSKCCWPAKPTTSRPCRGSSSSTRRFCRRRSCC